MVLPLDRAREVTYGGCVARIEIDRAQVSASQSLRFELDDGGQNVGLVNSKVPRGDLLKAVAAVQRFAVAPVATCSSRSCGEGYSYEDAIICPNGW